MWFKHNPRLDKKNLRIQKPAYLALCLSPLGILSITLNRNHNDVPFAISSTLLKPYFLGAHLDLTSISIICVIGYEWPNAVLFVVAEPLSKVSLCYHSCVFNLMFFQVVAVYYYMAEIVG